MLFWPKKRSFETKPHNKIEPKTIAKPSSLAELSKKNKKHKTNDSKFHFLHLSRIFSATKQYQQKKIHNSTKVSTRLQSYMDSSSSLIVSFFFNSASYFFSFSFIFSYVHKNKSSVQVGFFFFSFLNVSRQPKGGFINWGELTL